MIQHYTGAASSFDPLVRDISLGLTLLLRLFAVLFDTSHVDAIEHHKDMVLAAAVEFIDRLVAFLAIDLLITFVLLDGSGLILDNFSASDQVCDVIGHGMF